MKELSHVMTHGSGTGTANYARRNVFRSHTAPSSLFSAKDDLSLNYIKVGDLDF